MKAINCKKKNASFTLIELLVVIVIIGILAGVIMISTSSSIDKANLAKAQAFSKTMQNELLLDLISEWTFDNSNVPVEDTWGNNNGTLSGTTPPVYQSDCIFGGCYSFSGDDYIGVLDNDTFDTDSITVEAWVKASSSSLVNWATIIAKGNQGSNHHFWLHYTTATNKFRLECGDETTRKYANPIMQELSINTWYHVVGTYTPGSMFIYVNGVPGTEQTELTGKLGTNDYGLTMGKASYISSYYWSGLIDQARIYKKAFSKAQVKQNYIAGLDSLLSQGSISKEDYNQRINELAYEK